MPEDQLLSDEALTVPSGAEALFVEVVGEAVKAHQLHLLLHLLGPQIQVPHQDGEPIAQHLLPAHGDLRRAEVMEAVVLAPKVLGPAP